MKRLTVFVVLLAVAVAPVIAVGAGPNRDWTKAPAVVERKVPGEIFALGDVHGDYNRMIRLLVAAKVVKAVPDDPAGAVWSAGNAVLICTGDLIDKGHDALSVIAALRAVQTQAKDAGGEVIVLMGNHEAEFLANPLNRKDTEFLEELQARKIDPIAVANGTDELRIGRFLRGLPFGALLDDWFFSHAGNTHGESLDDLATALRDGVSRDGFGAAVLSDPDSLLEAKLKDHPWWEGVDRNDNSGEAILRRYAKSLGASHLVIGHQPESVHFADGTKRGGGEIFQKYDGLIFLIDVGMSSEINRSKGAILRIHGGANRRATVIDHDGNHVRLWPEAP
jgi:hypothetical protein